MTNERPTELESNNQPSENALLVEYQACQHDNNSSASTYWTLAGIFIGISSVLLGGLLYGILSNIQIITKISPNDASTLRIIISALGAAIIIILLFLYLWLKRVGYLMDKNYQRMREIELKLGMWKSWRVHIRDQWNKMMPKKLRFKGFFKSSVELSDEQMNQIWAQVLEKEKKGLSKEYHGLLEEKQEKLIDLCDRSRLLPWYKHPTRDTHYKVIFFTLIVVWVFFIVMAFQIIG